MAHLNKEIKNSKKNFLKRIARLYYINNLNQQEIANQLNIGRSSVARFLSEARDEGIVQIKIGTDDEYRRKDLENQLMNLYNTKDIVVISSEDYSISQSLIIEYLDTILPFKGNVGIGGGKTLYNLGKYIERCEKRNNLKIIQLTGSLGSVPETSIINMWSSALQSEAFFLHAPLLAINKFMKNAYLNDKINKKCTDYWKNLDVSIVGIGNTNIDSRILYADSIKELNIETIHDNYIGDILFHFFNDNGQFSSYELSEKVVGISPEKYMRIPLKIGIALNKDKAEAITAVLKAKLIDILIIDEHTAINILN